MRFIQVTLINKIDIHSLCDLYLIGDSEIDEMFKIFKILGTPNEDVWPGVSNLKDWNPEFPKWQRKDLSKLIPGLDENGLDLLYQLIDYNPARRISAKRGN
jgi:serine/threonine protein kinase